MSTTRNLRPLAAACLLLSIAGCASLPQGAARDPRDPLERYNRAAFTFNDGLDRAIVRPVARGYRKVLPDGLEIAISNFWANAKYPVTIVNDILQGKLPEAASGTGRFLLNTTVGFAGFGDPASELGLERRDEDFGQTLGRWGVPPGPYLVVPIFGPYTFRDALGTLADDFAEPRHYLEDDSTRWWLWAGDRLDRRVRLLDADIVLDRAGDRYAFVRSAYLQRREFEVRDGDVPPDQTILEDPDPAADE
jgi:phospholipid-binding lipoprotein MlaA